MLRRFGQLASLSSKALGKAITHFRSCTAEQRLSEKSDWPDYAKELLSAHHTSQALHELVSFAVAHKVPISLWRDKDLFQAEGFLMRALERGNMKDVNSALYLCHCHPYKPVPAFDVYAELVKKAPVGPPENQQLWRKTLGEMLYYSYPACMNEMNNDQFFAHYGAISEAFPAFMRLSVEIDDVQDEDEDEEEENEVLSDLNFTHEEKKEFQEIDDPEHDDLATVEALRSNKDQDHFVETYISQLQPETVTLRDYELAKNFVLHEVDENLRQFPRDALDLLLSVARVHRDYEFICRVYLEYELFSVDNRTDFLVSCVLEFLLQGHFTGSRWNAVKQVLQEHLNRPIEDRETELAQRSAESLLCQHSPTNDCMITALMEANLHERAAMYMYDCARLALPYSPQLEIRLAQHFFEKDDLTHLLLVRDVSLDMMNNRKLEEWTAILQEKLRKQGAEVEDEFDHEKHYKFTEPLLRPYMEGLGNSVADSTEPDYAYSEPVARIVTMLAPHRLDIEEAEHSKQLLESDQEEDDDDDEDEAREEAQQAEGEQEQEDQTTAQKPEELEEDKPEKGNN